MTEYPVPKKIRKLFMRGYCARQLSLDCVKLLNGFDRAIEYIELAHRMKLKAWKLFLEGFNFIGIELLQEYLNIAEKRIRDAQQQMRLF